jgi:hypothetical protein
MFLSLYLVLRPRAKRGGDVGWGGAVSQRNKIKAEGMALAVECLSGKQEALSSNPDTQIKLCNVQRGKRY